MRLQKKTMWFIGVAVEQETSAPPPIKNPRSASGCALFLYSPVALLSFKRLDSIRSSLITQRYGRTEVTQDITNYVYIE